MLSTGRLGRGLLLRGRMGSVSSLFPPIVINHCSSFSTSGQGVDSDRTGKGTNRIFPNRILPIRFRYPLGIMVMDRIHPEIRGLLVSRMCYVTGCNRYEVEAPRAQFGKRTGVHVEVDELRLQPLSAAQIKEEQRKRFGSGDDSSFWENGLKWCEEQGRPLGHTLPVHHLPLGAKVSVPGKGVEGVLASIQQCLGLRDLLYSISSYRPSASGPTVTSKSSSDHRDDTLPTLQLIEMYEGRVRLLRASANEATAKMAKQISRNNVTGGPVRVIE